MTSFIFGIAIGALLTAIILEIIYLPKIQSARTHAMYTEEHVTNNLIRMAIDLQNTYKKQNTPRNRPVVRALSTLILKYSSRL